MVSVRQRSDFSVTGQWEVETESRDGQRETHVFDAVIVSTGHFTQPHLPLRDFPGTIHSFLYNFYTIFTRYLFNLGLFHGQYQIYVLFLEVAPSFANSPIL